jgi:hypothetical protein
MGRLVYGLGSFVAEFDDRALAHLKAITLSKLRRNESFAFTCDIPVASGSGHVCLWINAAIPIQFQFAGSKEPTLNRAWLDELLQLSNSPNGLRLIPEPSPVRSVQHDEHLGGERLSSERLATERPRSDNLHKQRVDAGRI